MSLNRKAAKKLINDALKKQGFLFDKDGKSIIPCKICDKEKIRSLHSITRQRKLVLEAKFLKSNLDSLSHFFADGTDINVSEFSPKIIHVKADSKMARLFRLSSLLWSVPVSHGFGRRLRFLVIDESNGKLVGLFAIGDPVFNLQIRDRLIGWDHHQRAKALYHVMDIFILGAIPPYADLLCGKLIAMLAVSDEVRNAVYKKYEGKITNIRREKKQPHLVLLTTASALGRSSLYNRIKFKELQLYNLIGETKGWGHFHLGDGTYEMMRKFLEDIGHPIVKRNRFGQGPNWKMRTIRICLEELGLSSDLLKHGIPREIYIVPLASNYIEYLNDEAPTPDYYDFPSCELISFFKKRWLIPRSERIKRYHDITRQKTLQSLIGIVQNSG
jgi:hypothetical protein